MSIRARAMKLATALVPGQRSHLRPGGRAPGINVSTSDRGRALTLESCRGRVLVLSFAPSCQRGPFLRFCQELRDRWSELAGRGVLFYGVTPEGVQELERFREEHALPFHLVADARGDVSGRYGVLGGIGPLRSPRRVSFVIDPQGRVSQVFEPASPQGHVDELLAAIEEIP